MEQGTGAQFKLDLIQALAADTFKCALYGPEADIGPDTPAYTTDGEISGTGYTAGGEVLTFNGGTPKLINHTNPDGTILRIVAISFASVTWPALVPSPRGAMIYNASKSNRNCWVIDFGGTVNAAGGAFIIPSPVVDANNAMIRWI